MKADLANGGPAPEPAVGESLFAMSRPFVLFDYFRIPARAEELRPVPTNGSALEECAWARPAASSGRSLYWLPADSGLQGSVTGGFRIESIPIFGSILPDGGAKALLDRAGGSWRRVMPISDLAGTWVSSVWTDENANLFLPFDPNEIIERYWNESYLQFVASSAARAVRGAARRGYYRVRPIVPRPAQILTRRWFSRVQSRSTFPAWPAETALHDFYGLLFELVCGLVAEPVPMIAPWPKGYTWAFVLTHDVETANGYGNIDLLCDLEIAASYRSSWNFVPRNHHVLCDSVLNDLKVDGFEIGVHGLQHDGRDIQELDERLPAIREYAERWGAVGFRSPATLRNWKAMPKLGFDYDSTYFDTSPYEPQPGGCCSLLPYKIDDLVELPITLPQDHTLFEILGGLDDQLWLDKARFVRQRGGMALVLTHPDYARNEHLVRAYRNLLDEFADDASAWKALPRDVSGWWRRRAASSVVRTSEGWTVTGPAELEGRVVLLEPRR